MDSFAEDHVRALISRTRINEMKSLGWRVVGPGEEGTFLMEGPELDGRLARPLEDLFEDLIARALERADAADRVAGARRAA